MYMVQDSDAGLQKKIFIRSRSTRTDLNKLDLKFKDLNTRDPKKFDAIKGNKTR